MNITVAKSEKELQAVRLLFASTFRDIAPDAVPFTPEGHTSYDVMVAQAISDDGQLLGAAMTNRAAIAVQSLMMGDLMGYGSVVDKHRELDLMAVRPDARSSGIGAKLLAFLEDQLRTADIQVLTGNATADLELAKLRAFYERQGFTVQPQGAPPATILGKTWTHPLAPPAALYFYKVLAGSPIESNASIPKKVTPPDPAKARRPKKPTKPTKRRRR